jgi:hypothetical protein
MIGKSQYKHCSLVEERVTTCLIFIRLPELNLTVQATQAEKERIQFEKHRKHLQVFNNSIIV